MWITWCFFRSVGILKCLPHGWHINSCWWIFNSTSRLKDFAHWLHGNALWLSSCLRRVPLWVNDLLHILHWNNFSPVWVTLCCFRTFAALKCFPQSSQISRICFCWYFSSLKDFSNCSHGYLLCLAVCLKRWLVLENDFSHKLHGILAWWNLAWCFFRSFLIL